MRELTLTETAIVNAGVDVGQYNFRNIVNSTIVGAGTGFLVGLLFTDTYTAGQLSVFFGIIGGLYSTAMMLATIGDQYFFSSTKNKFI